MSDLARKYKNYLAPEAIVWVNGRKLSKDALSFSNLKVDMVIDGADTFSFTLSDAFDMQEMKPKKASEFSFGDIVEIHIGYADNRESKESLPILFKGVVTSIGWNFSQNGYLEITVEGKDFSFLMMKHKFRRKEGDEASWNDRSDPDVVREVFESTYKRVFSAKNVVIDSEGSPVRKQIRHKEESDYAFFASLAQRNGYEFFVQKDHFYFRKPPKKSKGEISLKYGVNILSFNPEFSVDKQVSKVRVVGLEFGPDKKKITAEAPEGKSDTADASTSALKELLKDLNNIEYEIRAPVESVEAAKKLAESKYKELSSGLMRAQLTAIGIPELKPGIYVNVEGLGSRFSKPYYIAKAVHTFGSSGYETSLELRNDSFKLTKGGGG